MHVATTEKKRNIKRTETQTKVHFYRSPYKCILNYYYAHFNIFYDTHISKPNTSMAVKNHSGCLRTLQIHKNAQSISLQKPVMFDDCVYCLSLTSIIC